MVPERALAVQLPGAEVLFSTRLGGVSEEPYESLNLGILTDDVRQNVRENRKMLAEEAGLDAASVAMGWQVHGADLKEWDEPPAEGSHANPRKGLDQVDGHLTERPGLGLLVLVADCLPVALTGGGRVAMLHCGWRGLAAGIVEQALRRFDEPPAAAVGPGIGPCCYEVGDEVLERVLRPDWCGGRPDAGPARRGRAQAPRRAASKSSSRWTCARAAATTCSSRIAATGA